MGDSDPVVTTKPVTAEDLERKAAAERRYKLAETFKSVANALAEGLGGETDFAAPVVPKEGLTITLVLARDGTLTTALRNAEGKTQIITGLSGKYGCELQTVVVDPVVLAKLLPPL